MILHRLWQVRFYPDTYHGFAIRGDPRNPGMEAVKEEVRSLTSLHTTALCPPFRLMPAPASKHALTSVSESPFPQLSRARAPNALAQGSICCISVCVHARVVITRLLTAVQQVIGLDPCGTLPPQVFRSTLEFLGESLIPQVEARYPRPLMDTRRARAMARAAQPPRAHQFSTIAHPVPVPTLILWPTSTGR